ncbi:MAG: sensor domain-containing diguanylate cyclase [Planctomycetota bacterium]|nr:sensor domain-containing diguanylate cyclase [Planctomycetota bacterium]
MIARAESFAPFAAGGLLLGTGFCAAGSCLGLSLPAGPLQNASMPVALLVGGAGVGIVLGAWERLRAQRLLRQARHEARRSAAQRDTALLQARRMRAQSEGLALMREIHRATAIPVRHERLQRILTFLADLFEAREVALFSAVAGQSGAGVAARSVQPAACLRLTKKEELFVTFDEEALARGDSGAPAQGVRVSSTPVRVAPKTATIAREGCHLFVEGTLERGGVPVGKVRWRRGANAEQDVLAQFEPDEILETALARLDYGPGACAFAAQALERGRTVRCDSGPGGNLRHGSEGLTLCVPLLADQRPLGVLRIRRSGEGWDGPEAEALEEVLLESAKHMALALKKDEDDRKAITDGLTGLYIKSHFLAKLEELRAEAAATGNSFCLVMCDIDHFKKVNDSHGHLSGDMVLKGVAAVLRRGLRSGDIAFRYGGEELALLLRTSSLEMALQTAERLRLAVQAAALRGEKGQPVAVTISLGVAHYEQGMTAEELISRADQALYASKQGGRNRCTRWLADTCATADRKVKEHVPSPGPGF